MLRNKSIAVVLPAYNAERSLEKTFQDIPHDIVDYIILVDDKSKDRTVEVAKHLGLLTIEHDGNKGYGANQKTCYAKALELGADIVIMVHPDYQYTPKLILSMASLIAEGLFDCVLGSRILGIGALRGGMPRYKYVANRVLTCLQNICLGYKLSEYHTGYRAFSRRLLSGIPFQMNRDDFSFDNQMLAQIIYAGYDIGEITCPTRYDADSSSINFRKSIVYGAQVLRISLAFRLSKMGVWTSSDFAQLTRVAANSRRLGGGNK